MDTKFYSFGFLKLFFSILLLPVFPGAQIFSQHTPHGYEIVNHIGGTVNCIHVNGTNAFVGMGTTFKLFNVQGSTYQKTSYYNLSNGGQAAGIAVHTNYAYIYYSNSRKVQVFNISNPQNITSNMSFEFSGATNISHMANSDYYLYFGLGSGGLYIYDLSNPTSANLVKTMATQVHYIHISGNYAYTIVEQTTNPKFVIFDITNKSNPMIKSTTNITGAKKVFVAGNFAYITTDNSWSIVDISNANNPVIKSTNNTGNSFNYICASNNKAYIENTSTDKLQIFDVTNSLAPNKLGEYSLSGDLKDIQVVDNTIYFSLGKFGAIDVTDPANPIEKGSIDEPVSAKSITNDGNKLYIADSRKVFKYNTSNPATPILEGSIPFTSDISKIATKENLLTTLNYSTGIVTLNDISDLNNPQIKSTYQSTGELINNICISGNNLFAPTQSGKLDILNIANAANLQKLCTFTLPGKVSDIYIPSTGNYAYFTFFSSVSNRGFCILDITNPASPVLINTTQLIFSPYCLQVDGNNLYVGGDGGTDGKSLNVYDITNKSNPVFKTSIGNSRTWDIDIVNGIIITSKPLGSIYTFTFNNVTNQFTEGPIGSCVYNSADFVTYSDGSDIFQYTGSGTSFYYNYKLLDLFGGTYVSKITTVTPQTKNLTISISPGEAGTDGCTTNPLPGTYSHSMNSTVQIEALPAADKGWNLKEYTGDASGTNRIVNVLMDRDKNVVANFCRPTLTLSGNMGPITLCPSCKENKKDIFLFTLTANNDDDWNLNSITFSTSGIGDEKNDVRIVKLYYLLEMLDSTKISSDNGNFVLLINKILKKGESMSFRVEYEFNCPLIFNESDKQFNVLTKSNYVDAEPRNYTNRLKLPPMTVLFTGGPLIIAPVWNSTKNEAFGKIQAAINYYNTTDGDVIKICPGEYSENIEVNKSLKIESYSGKDVTCVTALNPAQDVFKIRERGCTIKGLTISNAKTGKSGIDINLNNAKYNAGTITKIFDCTISSNYCGIKINSLTSQGSTKLDFNIEKTLITANDGTGFLSEDSASNHNISESQIIYNEDGIRSKGKIYVRDSKISNNDSSGIVAYSDLEICSSKDFISEINNNNKYGIQQMPNISVEFGIKKNYGIVLTGEDGGIIQINNNGLSGIATPLSLKNTTAQVQIMNNGKRITTYSQNDPAGSGIEAFNLLLESFKIHNNKLNGIIFGQSLNISCGNYPFEILRNGKNGITSDFYGEIKINGKENNWVKINQNGECGIKNLDGKTECKFVEVNGNGENEQSNPSGLLSSGIYTQFLNIENFRVNNNKGNGIIVMRDAVLKNSDPLANSEISFNNLYGFSVQCPPYNTGGQIDCTCSPCTTIIVTINGCKSGNQIGWIHIQKNNYSGIMATCSTTVTLNASYVYVYQNGLEAQSMYMIEPMGNYSGIYTDNLNLSNEFIINKNIGHGIFLEKGCKINIDDNRTAYISSNGFNGIYALKRGKCHLGNNTIINQSNLFPSSSAGFLEINENGLAGISNTEGIVYCNKAKISLNGSKYPYDGFGINAKEVNLNETILFSNKTHGINCGFINFTNGSAIGNEGYGIFIDGSYHKKSIIDEQVSIVFNKLGGINIEPLNTTVPLQKANYVNNLSYHLINSSNISQNIGDGLKNSSPSDIIIKASNISQNSGYGILNNSTIAAINAGNNWWGHSSGPGGSGSGQGDKISGNIYYSNYSIKPVGLTISTKYDTLYSSSVKQNDTISINIMNYIKSNDKVNLKITDSLGWTLNPVNLSTTLEDTLGKNISIICNSPSSLPEGTINKIKILAISETDPSDSVKKEVPVFSYFPKVSKIIPSQDSIKIGQWKKYQLSAACFDQYNNSVKGNLIWSVSQGSIDSNGLYTAGTNLGYSTITIRSGNIKSQVVVNTITSVPILNKITLSPSNAFIMKNNKYQFSAEGYDQFDSIITFSKIWTCTGGTIDTSGLFSAGVDTGQFAIQVKDKNSAISAGVPLSIIPNSLTLISPANNSKNQTTSPVLHWYYYPNTIRYHVQVSKDSLFNTIIHNDSNITTLSKIIESLDIKSIYYWRIKAIRFFDSTLWTSAWNFKTVSCAPKKFHLINPANNSIVQLTKPAKQIYFNWNKPSGISSEDTVFFNLFVFSSNYNNSFPNLKDTSLSSLIMNNLNKSQKYYWYVTASVGPMQSISDTLLFLTSSNIVNIIDNDNLPKEYAVSQNYPNPFNPNTTINYQLPKQSDVKIIIYNILGQKVKELVNERQNPGYYKILWDGRNSSGVQVSSGIYFYKIITGEFIAIKKMNLLK